MKYRKTKMLARESASTAATKTLDVTLTDVISRIQIRYEPINNGNTQTAHPAKCVSKIELVDGSDVLMSLSGMEAQALDFYDTKQGREYEMDMRDNMPDQEFFNLNFGRKLWDPLLAFDPKKFKNPQLKITHNKALGGSTPDDSYLTVYADVFDEKVPTPMGWLMAKEFYSYTVTAGAYKDITLPSDYVLRKMLIQAIIVATTFTDQLDELRISEDNLKRVPIDLGIYEFIVGFMKKYPLYSENIMQTLLGAGNNNCYITPGENVNVSPGVVGDATVYRTSATGGGRVILYTSANTVCMTHVTGYMPHGCLPIEFGDPDDPDDWYDITKIGNLELRLHAPGGATASPNIVLQQLRKYA